MDNLQLGEALKAFSPRILGYLIRLVGSFDDAEDLHQEVMLLALRQWQDKKLPDEPLAWLFTVARNKGVDYLRRARTKAQVLETIGIEKMGIEPLEDQSLEQYLDDDLLRLIFTCCHPAIDPTQSYCAYPEDGSWIKP
jgi:RNA polymerase sigma-70 factor (ECF subfamily)